jgi:NAD(P)-dependent dehydrogenase (short-subunit alcohol dehydrogenase family)
MGMLDEKSALVSGASSGIGRAAAMLFAREGASLILVARRAEPLEDCARAIRNAGGRAIALPGDVTEPETHARAVDAARREFGGLDIAFNNAGVVGAVKPLVEQTSEEWSQVLAANLTSAFLAARTQIPAMLERGEGSLIFTGSFVGSSVGLTGMAAYASA